MDVKKTGNLHKGYEERTKKKIRKAYTTFFETKFKSLPKEKLMALKISAIFTLFFALLLIITDLLFYIPSAKSLISPTVHLIIKYSIYLIGISSFLYVYLYKYIKKTLLLERENKEEALRESEESYRKLVELLPNAVHVKHKGRIIFTNDAGAEIYGFNNKDELIGKLDSDFTHPDYRQISKKRGKKVLQENTSVPLIEVKCIRVDGKVIDVEVTSNSITLNGEKVILSVIRDITEMKKWQKIMETTLKDNEKLLEKTIEHDRVKTEYFLNISHEFKTPLNVILGVIQLLEVYKNSDTQNINYDKIFRNIFTMKQNCYRLLRLINNILDINKADLKFLELNMRNHNIVKVIEDITLSVAKFIEDKGLSLIIDTEVEEKFIMCDVDKIERIILNLLSNSIKYNDIGGKIYVNIYDRDEFIIISVKDNGVGIPKDKQHHIFERFRRIDSSLRRKNEGSGIGLSIVKSFVEKHGGKIWVESEIGKGTEFFIKLPVKISNEDDMTGYEDCSSNIIDRINIEFSDIYL